VQVWLAKREHQSNRIKGAENRELIQKDQRSARRR